jgi:hypothetical protein
VKKFLVVCKFGKKTWDVELNASSAEKAARRAEMSLRFRDRNFEGKSEIKSVTEIA